MDILQGLQDQLPASLAMLQRGRQRAFQAALNGDFASSASQQMARPGDDLLTEALAEQGASVKNAPGLVSSPAGLDEMPLSVQGLQAAPKSPLRTVADDYYAQKYPGRSRWTQGTTYSTPIEQ